jgi:hypothetical protein
MSNSNKTSILISFLSFGFLACAGSGDGVGINVHAVSLTPGSAGSALSLQDQGGADFSMTSALVHLRHIELDLPEGKRCADIEADLAGGDCLLDDKIRIPGPFVVDLVTGTSEPDLGAVLIPAGTYKRIDIRVDDGDPEEGLIEPGSPLDDYSLVVEAKFTYNQEPATLKLSLNFDEDIRIEQLAGVAVQPGTDLVAEFVVNDWLAGVDIAGCLASGELALDETGTATIDDNADGACGGVEDIIKNNMKNSGQFDR